MTYFFPISDVGHNFHIFRLSCSLNPPWISSVGSTLETREPTLDLIGGLIRAKEDNNYIPCSSYFVQLYLAFEPPVH